MYIVFIDFSRSSLTALTFGAHLAAKNNKRLHLVHVLDQVDMIYDSEELEETVIEKRSKENLEKLNKLASVANLNNKLSITCEVSPQMEEGDFVSLLRINKPELILSGLERQKGIIGKLKDNSAADFLSFTVVPVLFVPEDFKIPESFNILSALDAFKPRMPDSELIDRIFNNYSLTWFSCTNKLKPFEKETIRELFSTGTVDRWIIHYSDAVAESLLKHSDKDQFNLITIFPEDLSKKGFFVSGISEKVLKNTKVPVLAIPFHTKRS